MLTNWHLLKDRREWQRVALVPAPIVLALLLGASLALALQLPAAASGGVVTNCANDADFSAKLAGGGNISFNCNNAHQAATIALSSQKTILLPTSIDGGDVITLSGDGLTRLFNVPVGASLSLASLTLEHGQAGANDGGAISNDGSLSVNAVTFYSNTVDTASNAGGAIFSDGALTVTNSSFLSNAAYNGGAIDTSGRLYIGNSVFDHNQAVQDHGGALEDDGGMTTIVSGTFSNNSAALGGGAISSYSGIPLAMSDSAIFSNTTPVKGFGTKGGGGLELDGKATLDNVQVYGNQATGTGAVGGGIFLYTQGVLMATGVKIWGNQASSGAGLYNFGTVNLANADIYGNAAVYAAGGLYDALNATLLDVRIYSNTAVYDGGGLRVVGAATLSQVDIYSNTVTGAGGYGGGLDLEGVFPVSIDGARIYSNTVLDGQFAGAGAGIYAQDYYTPVTLSNSSVYNNVAVTGPGGGIAFYSQSELLITGSSIYGNRASSGLGGGIFAASEPASAALILVNSTIAGNQATQGGGIYNAVGNSSVALTNTTVTSNTAASGSNLIGPVVAVNTIIAGSAPTNCGNPITSNGHNLEAGNSCGLHASGDLTNTNPLLGPLQDNGGPTLTLLPGAGSPAIDHGNDAACPAVDQRGVARPHGPHCDIGSVEIGPLAAWRVYLPLELKKP